MKKSQELGITFGIALMMAMLGFFGNSSANYLWNIANKQPITMDAHIFGIISLALFFFIATGALYYINRLIKK